MKVLSVTPEIFPLIKTGGLADVTGALPLALARQGIEVKTLIPGFIPVMKQFEGEAVHAYDDLNGGPATVLMGTVAGLDLLVLDAPHLFTRAGGPYADPSGNDWPDNWQRFASLSRVGADIGQGKVQAFQPDLVHVHDWQAALTLAYLRFDEARTPPPPSVITVHNLAFQGQYGADIFRFLGLPPEAMSVDGVEYYGDVGYLKAGLRAASAITTVSPTYAQEIRDPAFGMGLDGLINTRAGDLTGIVNGIDTLVWDPSRDPHLKRPFSIEQLEGRKRNRAEIERRFFLEEGDEPILAVVSRLTWQKGIDLIAAELDNIVAAGAKLAILGKGDADLEIALAAGTARHHGRVGLHLGYDEGLSHLMQGGADVILVPSRFEPCGLTQLYGLRYGCVPAVARTGGLADTVIDANEAALAAGVATGFQFASDSGSSLTYAVRRIVDAYRDRDIWNGLMREGMKADVSWDRSAARYAALFRSLVSPKEESA
ncbi:MAG: glycogen synthase GlgA [Methylobacterium mesophilicum]|nr:glycogen synthase GlgA [Methylobacterium mesophilicum]